MNDDASLESSIDGELTEFLKTQGLLQPEHVVDSADESFSLAFDRFTVEQGSFEVLLPNYLRLNSLLHENGVYPMQFTACDVNSSTEDISISITLLDSWAASLLPAISEMIERLNSHNFLMRDVSISAWKGEVSKEALESRVRELQTKLLESEKKGREASSKAHHLAIDLETTRTTQKMSEEISKKQLKNMEQVVHENERRMRQKESDLNRLREKLVSLSSTSNRLQRKGHQFKSSVNDLIDTSLIKEIDLLSVRDASSFGQGVQPAKMETVTTSYREVPPEKSPVFDSVHVSVQSDGSYDEEISDSRRQLEHLSHKMKVLENDSSQKEELISKLRSMVADLRNEVDNLRSELDARPGAKQWAHAQQEIKELEEKLHDAMLLRKETNNIQFWKKHMSTRDKIRTDRRNFELGLWLIDSLPKTVLKESLQMVCRELNISEVSDIKPSLDKMKAVIHSIPRMENFIEQVCVFLFKRSKRSDHELPEKSFCSKPILEEVLPLLHSWWAGLQKGLQLDKFRSAVIRELERREKLLSQMCQTGQINNLLPKRYSIVYDNGLWSEHKSTDNVEEVIRDLVDFQVDSLGQRNNVIVLQDFMNSNPDEMLVRVLSHLQHIFGITHIEGLIPKMNQIYIFTQEMTTFLKSIRSILGVSSNKDFSDSSLLIEIERVISESCNKSTS